MDTFDNITAARDAIADYCAGPLLDEGVAVIAAVEAFNVLPSPVDQIVRTGEYLFAQRAGISDAGKALAGGLIAFATGNGWHGLRDDGRGDAMVAALGEVTPVSAE
jgi:hypothetical protein